MLVLQVQAMAPKRQPEVNNVPQNHCFEMGLCLFFLDQQIESVQYMGAGKLGNIIPEHLQQMSKTIPNSWFLILLTTRTTTHRKCR